MIFVVLTLTSCNKNKIVYKDRIVEVLIPQRCMPPPVFCDFNRSTYTEVLDSLLECIVDLKRSNEVCE